MPNPTVRIIRGMIIDNNVGVEHEYANGKLRVKCIVFSVKVKTPSAGVLYYNE